AVGVPRAKAGCDFYLLVHNRKLHERGATLCHLTRTTSIECAGSNQISVWEKIAGYVDIVSTIQGQIQRDDVIDVHRLNDIPISVDPSDSRSGAIEPGGFLGHDDSTAGRVDNDTSPGRQILTGNRYDTGIRKKWLDCVSQFGENENRRCRDNHAHQQSRSGRKTQLVYLHFPKPF